MAGGLRERSLGRWELRVFIGKDPVAGKPIQITRSHLADRKEPGAGKRAAERTRLGQDRSERAPHCERVCPLPPDPESFLHGLAAC